MEYWIVVVDDEVMSLTNVRNMLGEENMKVSCLRSGRDLLKFMEKNTPDLILLDIMMPDMDGFETYHALRKYEEGAGKPPVPVIFLTGEVGSASERLSFEIGASDYIRKPFNKEIIVKRIENSIKNSRTIETLTEEAMFDKLTGFLNKARGTERVAKLCGRKTGVLMIMDLDNFKLVNDLFGHDMGDRVLRIFADTIRNNTRETDTISRIGGDEFMAFYEDVTEEGIVAALTLRLNTQFGEETEKVLGPDHGIPLGISVGAVMVPENGRDYDTLFSLADAALYTVKQNGKHGYHVSSRVSDDEADNADLMQRLDRIMKIVEERNERSGALLLGTDSFSQVYRFVMRFYKRYGGTAALILFSLSPKEEEDNLKFVESSARFSSLLQKTLRMSDLIMQNGTNSFFVMLTERTKAEAEGAAKRILDAWNEAEKEDDILIEYAFRYIDQIGDSHT